MLRRVIPALHALSDLQILMVCGLGCRWASRDARVWTGQKRAQPGQDPRAKDPFIEDPDMAEVEDRLQALEREEKRKRAAIKFQRLRKQMSPPGPLERRLSWDAMDQIRYLKQEFPEEWTVARLAEGFSVSTEVIHRVLRSKFIPSLERRAKQDAKASAERRQQTLPAAARPGEGAARLPGSRDAPLPAGTGSALSALGPRSPLGAGRDVATTAPSGGGDGAGALTLPTAPSGGGDGAGALTLPPAPRSPAVWSSSGPEAEGQAFLTQEEQEQEQEEEGEGEEEDEDSWDGRVLSDTELEELVRTRPEQNCHVVQKGSEFFDSVGNFLYRI